jgi:2-keto-4-pentenoate hydratase
MPLDEKEMEKISQELMEAERKATPITNLTDRFPEVTVPEAYAIQMKTVQAKLKSGQVIVGRKIGLCAKANQQMFGVDEPIYGTLFHPMVVPEGEPIPVSRLIRPVIEGEICFVLKNEIRGPGVDVGKVLAATAGVIPAFEIADNRYKEQRRKAPDPISDDSGATMVVLGGQLTPVANIDLRLIGMVLEKDSEIIATGAGAAVLGNPAQPVASPTNWPTTA